MRFEVVGEVAAPVEDVWAWWTDFGEPGDVFRMKHGMASTTRSILARDGASAVIEDKSIIGTIRRTIRLDASGAVRVVDESAEGGQTYESHWRFEAVGPGRTRITRSMRVRAAAIFGPLSRWITQHDLAFHCREAERALRGRRT